MVGTVSDRLVVFADVAQSFFEDVIITGVYSSFLIHAERASERYGVPAWQILEEIGRAGYVGGQEDMIVDVAVQLASGARVGQPESTPLADPANFKGSADKAETTSSRLEAEAQPDLKSVNVPAPGT